MAQFKKPRDLTLGNAYLNPEKSREAGDPEQELRQKGYSWAYHRFFEGYAERKVLGPDGKEKIERYFIGDTHRHRMTDAQWICLKLAYFLIYLLAAGAFLIATTKKAAGNYLWYVQVGEALCGLSLFILLYFLILYLASKRVLDTHSYRQNTVFFPTVSLIAAITGTLTVIAEIIHVIMDHGAGEGMVILLLMISTILSLALWVMEKKLVKYDKELGKDAPYDAINL